MRYPSRNKSVEHGWYFYCPYCNAKHFESELKEEDYDNFSDSTKIVYCKSCGWEFVPEKTRDILYKYS